MLNLTIRENLLLANRRAGENEILKTITELSADKTIMTIAHRFSTVLICDRVALMEDGGIAAIEKPSDMFRENSRFTTLFKQQYGNMGT